VGRVRVCGQVEERESRRNRHCKGASRAKKDT